MTTEAEQRLLQFLYLAPVGLVEAARDGSVVNLNPLATQTMIMLSGSPDLSNVFRSFAGPFPDLAERVAAHDGLGVVVDSERFEHDHRTGDSRNFALTVHLIAEDRLAFVISDISALVAQEREVRRKEAELRSIFDSVRNHMIVSVDAAGLVQSHNASIERLTGFGADVVGQPASVFFAADVAVDDLNQAAVSAGWTEVEGDMVGPAGSTWWGSAAYTHIVDELERTAGFALVVREDTERHAREEQLTEWANHDPLTGLATRRSFESALDGELVSARGSDKPIAFMMLDVDHFKAVNDTHGHQVGDEVLVELARRLVATVRPQDLVVRMGGEEFGVLLVDADPARADVVAERLRAVVEARPFTTEAGDLPITVSGGVRHWEPRALEFADVYAAADEALYEAKESGRNRVVSR